MNRKNAGAATVIQRGIACVILVLMAQKLTGEDQSFSEILSAATQTFHCTFSIEYSVKRGMGIGGWRKLPVPTECLSRSSTIGVFMTQIETFVDQFVMLPVPKIENRYHIMDRSVVLESPLHNLVIKDDIAKAKNLADFMKVLEHNVALSPWMSPGSYTDMQETMNMNWSIFDADSSISVRNALFVGMSHKTMDGVLWEANRESASKPKVTVLLGARVR